MEYTIGKTYLHYYRTGACESVSTRGILETVRGRFGTIRKTDGSDMVVSLENLSEVSPMIDHAFSEVEFPDGHKSTRVFRWFGVSAPLSRTLSHCVSSGGVFTCRPATPDEVATSEAARLQALSEVAR